MTEIQPAVAATPMAPSIPAVATPTKSPDEASGAGDALSKDPIETFLANGRLQINANVGVEGISRLKQMLEKYEELMRLMN